MQLTQKLIMKTESFANGQASATTALSELSCRDLGLGAKVYVEA
jgi:hypothetical protein